VPPEKRGGYNAYSAKAEAEARAFAEQMRPIFAEVEALTTTQAAAVLNARGIPTVGGRKWTHTQVLRVRRRLAQAAER
jgi:hypothetical protein